MRDGAVLSLSGTDDTLDVLRSGAAVNLGSVNLKQDYVKAGKTVTLNATMTASTVTTNGDPPRPGSPCPWTRPPTATSAR